MSISAGSGCSSSFRPRFDQQGDGGPETQAQDHCAQRSRLPCTAQQDVEENSTSSTTASPRARNTPLGRAISMPAPARTQKKPDKKLTHSTSGTKLPAAAVADLLPSRTLPPSAIVANPKMMARPPNIQLRIILYILLAVGSSCRPKRGFSSTATPCHQSCETAHHRGSQSYGMRFRDLVRPSRSCTADRHRAPNYPFRKRMERGS